MIVKPEMNAIVCGCELPNAMRDDWWDRI